MPIARVLSDICPRNGCGILCGRRVVVVLKILQAVFQDLVEVLFIAGRLFKIQLDLLVVDLHGRDSGK